MTGHRDDLLPQFVGEYHVTSDPDVFVNGYEPCTGGGWVQPRWLVAAQADAEHPHVLLLDGDADLPDEDDS